jgi:tetratricopeptide (TPR) repeat protein
VKTYLTAGLCLLFALNGTLAMAADAPTGSATAAKSTDPADSAIRKADGLMDRGQFDKAADAFHEVIRQFPDSAKAHSRLGAALAAKHDLDERKGDKAGAQNDYDTAILEEKTAIKIDGKIASPHIILGQIYANQAKLQDAIAEFNEALKIKPTMFTANLDLGVAYLTAGDIDNAIASFKKAEELRPDEPVPHINLGILLDKKGNHKDAISEELEAIRVDKAHQYVHDSYVNLGNIYLDAKDLDNAKDYFQRALKVAPGHPNALSGLGWVQSEKGFVDEGIKKEREALANSRGFFVPAHTRLGMMFASQKKNDEADKEFKEALRISPKDLGAGVEYAKFLANSGKKEEAKAQYKKMLEFSPKFAPAVQGLASLEGTK